MFMGKLIIIIIKNRSRIRNFRFSLMASTSLFFSTLLMALTLSIRLSDADPRIDVVSKTCRNTTVSDESDYRRSYQKSLDHIDNGMNEHKFGTHENGGPPQRMYVLWQCMNDLTPAECRMCLSRAADLLSRCFPATGGRVYLDGCFIRADNYSFYHEILTHDDVQICSSDKNQAEEFEDVVAKVTDAIIDLAPGGSGFAVHHKSSKGLTVYGMGICWETLDMDSCKLCLSDGAVSALNCLPSKEGHALNAGCFLRYSDHPFYNDHGLIIFMSVTTAYIMQIISIIAVCVSAITVGFCVGKYIYMRKSGKYKQKEKESSPLNGSSNFMRFKYSTLQTATDNFSDSYKLGVGGYGEVFKGTLPDGREIAIKRLLITGNKPPEDIHNEIDVISKCQHKNLVRFLGCCFTNLSSFVVYEFLANTSLDHILFDPGKKKELDWKKRLMIILGTAEGLEYLHEVCHIVHRDIKASNILLDLKYKPKISDFGLAKFFPGSSHKNHFTSSRAGTLGYMAPEYIGKGRLTNKIDVYSFGVLVLEITSGVRNNKFQSDNSLETLVTRTWKCFETDTVEEIIDRSMGNADVEEIKRVIQIGLLCTQESVSLRPSMAKVIEMITKLDLVLPSPTKPPFVVESI